MHCNFRIHYWYKCCTVIVNDLKNKNIFELQVNCSDVYLLWKCEIPNSVDKILPSFKLPKSIFERPSVCFVESSSEKFVHFLVQNQYLELSKSCGECYFLANGEKLLWCRISRSGYGACKLNFENRNCSLEFWEWTSQQLTCKLNFENSFWISGSGCSTCKLNFENRNCLEIWEWTSQQLNCKLNFENFFLDLEVVVAPANWISKIEISLWSSGKGPLNS